MTKAAQTATPPSRTRVGQAELKVRKAKAEELRARGITVSAWARGNGFQRHVVSAVLKGELMGEYGEAHQICVALGLKSGSSCRPEDFKATAREAA